MTRRRTDKDVDVTESFDVEVLVQGFLGAPPEMLQNHIPEGPAFDREGRLHFVSAVPDATGHTVFRLEADDRTVTPVVAYANVGLASLVFHRDGRMFLADLFGGPDGAGRIAVVGEDGEVSTLVDEFEGTPIMPDDLIFDAEGRLYYNDFQGRAFTPTGRVIRLDPDGSQHLIMDGLAMPNGIALSPDARRLWITEHAKNRLVSFELDSTQPGSDARVHAHFSGGMADSTTIDRAGTVYQAFFGGGRFEVLDHEANLVGVIRPPAGEPNTTHIAIRPGTRDGYYLAGGPAGISIGRFTALAEALTPFSHS